MTDVHWSDKIMQAVRLHDATGAVGECGVRVCMERLHHL